MKKPFASRLVLAAKSFHDYSPGHDKTSVAENEDSRDTIRRLFDVLWCEAHSQMATPIKNVPSDTYSLAVDLETARPGIINNSSASEIYFASDVSDGAEHRVTYGVCQDVPQPCSEPDESNVVPTVSRKTTNVLAKMPQKRRTYIKKLEGAAERQVETPDERKARLEAARARRNAAADSGNGAPPAKKRSNKPTTSDEPRKDESTDETHPALAPVASSSTESGVARHVDWACVQACDSVIPCKLRKSSKSKHTYYRSPVPVERSLFALQFANPAVEIASAALCGVPTDAVRVIEGPPGTGKTAVLCEQIVAHSAHERVLVCATTNVATCNLYQRLLTTSVCNDISLCMPPDRIPRDMPFVCNDPTRRIVCATVSSRAGPHLHNQSFDAVYVDEAAQCTEANTWTLLRKDVTSVVLAGDIHQLPSTVSHEGREQGHDVSLMQRLIDRSYPTTRLTVQYRMHPEICRFPSDAFYSGSLLSHESCTRPTATGNAYTCTKVAGEPRTIGDSWENEQECDACVRVVTELRARGFDADRIVLISPYQGQCCRLLSRKCGVAVHTVDSFQGREADAVVLSVVRTGCETGFWNDYRRLNVALTRARDHMTVVGSFDWTTGPLSMLVEDARSRQLL